MELLRCEHITKIYGKGAAAVKALNDVSFRVEQGEFVSIVGPSGSGKSTLLHILGGVDKPTEGKVFVGNTDIHSLNEDKLAIFRRRQIGLVYQFYNLLPVLNVEENILLPHLLDGRPANRERLKNILSQMGLSAQRHHLPSQLSGGQQQRVSIGRALFNHPAILLADEPTGALDQSSGQEVLKLFRRLNELGNTIVMITHDLSVARNAGRIVHLIDGELKKK